MKLWIVFFLLVSCSGLGLKSARNSPDWKKDSQKLIKAFAKSYGLIDPFWVSDSGFVSFESKTQPFSKDFDKISYALLYRWQSRLTEFLRVEKNEDLRMDAQILLEFVNLRMEEIDLGRRHGIVPFIPVGEYVFSQLSHALSIHAGQRRRANAMAKFRAFVRGADGQLPLVDGVTSYTLRMMDFLRENRRRGFWPTRHEVETYLRESQGYLDGLHELLSTWKKDDHWKRDFAEFTEHEKRYREFLTKKVLPYSRKTDKMPAEIYQFQLRAHGVLTDPRDLMSRARSDYQRLYGQFATLARDLAARFALKENSPFAVVTFLRSRQIREPDALRNAYLASFDRLFKIVKENKLLSVRDRAFIEVRFATPAEAQQIPSPNFIGPMMYGKDLRPPLMILMPLTISQDYSFPEAVVTLSAHEAIPGHALQNQIVRERGTSLIRSRFAFNSANLEAWALYAEELVYPYLTQEEQFVSLQRRLWRVARAFLDPEINLGLATREDVTRVYHRELGFTPAHAEVEYKRYSVVSPGQATSYYYGFMALKDLKAKVKDNNPETFTESCFNDAVMELGLAPVGMISSRLGLTLRCGPSLP